MTTYEFLNYVLYHTLAIGQHCIMWWTSLQSLFKLDIKASLGQATSRQRSRLCGDETSSTDSVLLYHQKTTIRSTHSTQESNVGSWVKLSTIVCIGSIVINQPFPMFPNSVLQPLIFDTSYRTKLHSNRYVTHAQPYAQIFTWLGEPRSYNI